MALGGYLRIISWAHLVSGALTDQLYWIDVIFVCLFDGDIERWVLSLGEYPVL